MYVPRLSSFFLLVSTLEDERYVVTFEDEQVLIILEGVDTKDAIVSLGIR